MPTLSFWYAGRPQGAIPVLFIGCANYKFPKVFKEYTLEHRLNLVALMEPRQSGKKADRDISKLGFQKSYRVEADGEVYVYYGMTLLTIEVASPYKQKRRLLWSDITASVNCGSCL
ncbi:hypothetical protein V6N11_034087 [Hibiscus sabdariffa]|uniref:Uncharacterized protein n=1 Tax=Hibiscus sabdariffa TaxID=183260 RepID=A0ABR2S1E7_9ROSI